jgi:hypothetical protein
MEEEAEFLYQKDRYRINVEGFEFYVDILHINKDVKDIEVSLIGFPKKETITLSIYDLKAILKVLKEGGYKYD